MTIQKAHWDTEGDNVRLSMPFSKVDKERRVVSGFATLDNVDKQADIVTTDASLKAFAKFRGNIREMHQPTAVGKMISFKEDKYFDPDTKKFYSGVYVSTYISKGAQDTWEKVLDGTLSGFSIGGRMNKWDDGYDEKIDSKIRIIKDYDLVELSLVDNPANQFANVLSVEKVDGVDMIKGESLDTPIENVFWDAESGIVMLSENDSEVSPTSNAPMQNIGFVEKNDNEKTDMIKFLVDSAKGINTIEIKKEVGPMNEETAADVVEKSDEVEESQVAPEADAPTEDAVEKSYSEDKEKSMDEEKMEDEDEIKSEDEAKSEDEMKSESAPEEDEVSKSNQVIADAVTEIQGTLTSAFSDLANTVKALHEQVSALSKSIDSVKTEVTEAKGQFNEFGKRVDAVEADTAFRKSGDLGEIVQEAQSEQIEKSLWGGRFLKTADLFR
jgi:Putative phage serine protease XkdF